MRPTWRSELLQLALIVAMFVVAAVTWSSAPDRIPVHWNAQGDVDRYGGKFEGLLVVPLMALGLYLLLLVIPRFDPGRANYRNFAGAYTAIRTSIIVLHAGVYAVLQLWIHDRPVRLETVIPIGIGLLFVVLGNLMGKIRPNWFVGIRTPWTLTSKRSWTRTHRLGGWLFVAFGLSLVAAAWIGVTGVMIWLVLGGAIATATVSAVYSYLVWRDDPDRLPPAGSIAADSPE